MGAKLRVFKDASEAWRVRLEGGNGEKVATTEAYDSKSNARRAADWMKGNTGSATIVEE